MLAANEAAIAWAAGLFEGEGCITQDSRSGLPRIELAMSDEDVVTRFISIVGYGNLKIKEFSVYKPHYKPQWRWAIQKASEVNRILTMFLPYLGQRRAYKALNALDILDNIY
jgi:hypothetical protein